MIWTPAPDALVELIEEHADQIVVGAEYARLPFYREGYLVEAKLCGGARARMVFCGEQMAYLIPLTGSVEQIIQANHLACLQMNRENVSEYVRFFCNHLMGPEGFFLIAEDSDGVVLESGRFLRRTRVMIGAQEGDGSFRVGAYQFYDSDLYRVSFRVEPSGQMVMLKELYLGPCVGSWH